ncbi:hypothetical protein PINS_up019092 [Pythium insidiosum]|nr:hypothetical protein PINS_up019092 [Pythium insidiosum]
MPLPPLEVIPALFKMLDRCEQDDIAALRGLFQLQANDTLQSGWERLTSSTESPSQSLNEVTAGSPLLTNLLTASELWTFPSVSQDDEIKKMEDGIFAVDTTSDYALFCMFNGDWKDPSCPSLIRYGKQMKPARDFSNIPLSQFRYTRDEYFHKVAKIPRNASVMVMNGKLDFQTVFSGAKEQYEKMEGAAKLLVEFPYAGHCPGLNEVCGTTIIASFLRNGGSVNATNTSCVATLPAPNFDMDTYIKSRLAPGGSNSSTSVPNAIHVRSAAVDRLTRSSGIVPMILTVVSASLLL